MKQQGIVTQQLVAIRTTDRVLIFRGQTPTESHHHTFESTYFRPTQPLSPSKHGGPCPDSFETLAIRARIVEMSEFVTIPEGWFLMGSEEGQPSERPVHSVWVDTFEMAVYPVTRDEYACFLNATGHTPPREWHNPALRRKNLPVVGVSWHDSRAFCEWQAHRDGTMRLPTEAEWERAARGGQNGQRYPWGDSIPNWVPNEGRGPLGGPWPVTVGQPNGFGLYGIGANIHEWCANWHQRDFYRTDPAVNPIGPEEGLRRASRGGAWRHALTINRTAARSSLNPAFRYTDYGFRLARSL